jgi:hypothetical protein
VRTPACIGLANTESQLCCSSSQKPDPNSPTTLILRNYANLHVSLSEEDLECLRATFPLSSTQSPSTGTSSEGSSATPGCYTHATELIAQAWPFPPANAGGQLTHATAQPNMTSGPLATGSDSFNPPQGQISHVPHAFANMPQTTLPAAQNNTGLYDSFPAQPAPSVMTPSRFSQSLDPTGYINSSVPAGFQQPDSMPFASGSGGYEGYEKKPDVHPAYGNYQGSEHHSQPPVPSVSGLSFLEQMNQ